MRAFSLSVVLGVAVVWSGLLAAPPSAWGQPGPPAGDSPAERGPLGAPPGAQGGKVLRLPPGERPGIPGRPLPPEVAKRLLELKGGSPARGPHAGAAWADDHAGRPTHGAAKAHEAAEGHGGSHHVNWVFLARKGEEQPFLATLFNFLVLALLLGRFGVPPIREFVKSRHERIAKDLAEASRIRKEAEDRLREYEAKLASIDQEIAKLLTELRAEGEAERDRIIASAEEQASRLRRDAELAIAQEMRRARQEIEREAVTAAMAAAEKLLRERATDADQRAFVERYLVALSSVGADDPLSPRRGAA